MDPDRWEFANEHFLRDSREALKDIHRRKPTGGTSTSTQRQQQAAIEVGQYGGLSDEIDALKRDKNILMMELVRIRQQQQVWMVYVAQVDAVLQRSHVQSHEQHMHQMQQRLVSTEQRQHNLMAFMAKMLQNPGFMQQVMALHKQHELRQIAQGESDAPGTLFVNSTLNTTTMLCIHPAVMMPSPMPRVCHNAANTTGRKKRRAGVTGEELEDPNNESALVEYQPPGSDFANLLLNFMDSPTARGGPEWEAPPLTAFDGLSLGGEPLMGEPLMGEPMAYPPLIEAPVPVPVTVMPQAVMGSDGAPPVPDVVTMPPAPGAFLGEAMQPIVQSPPAVEFEDLGLSPELMVSMDSAPMGDAAGDDSFWQTLLNNADSLVKQEP